MVFCILKFLVYVFDACLLELPLCAHAQLYFVPFSTALLLVINWQYPATEFEIGLSSQEN